MTKKAKDAHTFRGRRDIKKDVRFNRWELEMLEKAVHLQGLMTGDFPPLAGFIRAAAIGQAFNRIRRFNRIKKAERDQLEAEYELECAEN